MTVYHLQPNAASRRHATIEAGLKAAIPGLIKATSLREILSSGTSRRGELVVAVVILPQGDHQEFEQLVEFAARHAREIFLVLIGDEISTNDYKRVIRTGGADWVSANADAAEVVEIIAGRKEFAADTASSHAPAAGGRPITISFVPSAGGVGNTTLVLETALQLKSDKKTQDQRICVIDLDFQTSHICDYVDSEPRLKIADLSSAPERLDEHLFESYRTRLDNGLDIFAAPRSKFTWEKLNIEALDALLTMIAGRYDLVLIACPLPWFSWTSQVIGASDAAIITGINTIPCLRQVCETLELVRASGASLLQTAIVINRCDYTLLGSIARRKHVGMVLRDEQVFFIANRPEAIECINMGQPMMLSSAARRLRKDLLPLANFCAGLKSRSAVSR